MRYRHLAARLLLSTGMRLLEGLRVKGVDSERREIIDRDGNGGRAVLSPFDRLGAE